MSQWPSAKARAVLAALLRIGWSMKQAPGKALEAHGQATAPGGLVAYA